MGSQRYTYMFRVSAITLILSSGIVLTGEVLGDELPAIFNGQELSGWRVPSDNIWWKAEDGILRVQSGPRKQGSVLWTEKEYRNFVMEFEFRMGSGTVDSGVFLRDKKEQIQIGISGSLKRDMTASPYIAGKGYPVEAEGVKDRLKLDQWNVMTIVAIGSSYSVWLNGSHVLNYSSDTAVETGPVGIQLHAGREMAIDYRNIRLGELR